MRHFLSLMMLLVALCVPWVTQAQVSVPYTEDFESSSLSSDWTVMGGTVATYSSTAYQGSRSLRFSGSLRNMVALPEFTEPVNTLQLTFWTRPEGTTANPGSFDVGYVTSLTDTSTFVALETYACTEFSGAYQQKTLYLSNVPASVRLAFRHRSNSASYYWFVDNLEVKLIPTCFPVSNLVFSNLTPQGADLSWTPNALGSESQYQVCCVPFGTTPDWTNATLVNTPSITFTGLNTYSAYEACVRSYCSSTDQSEEVHAMFMTAPDCGTASLRQFAIGNGNSTTYYAPFVSYNSTSTSYKNGASWQIFTGDELAAFDVYAGDLKGIALQPEAGSSATIPFQIFIGHTTMNEFATQTDTIDRATLTKVFDGSYTFDGSKEWNEIIFDTPFAYDGSSNIVVMFYRPEPAVTTTLRFNYTSPGLYRTIYRYGATSLSSGSRNNSYRDNMRFTMCVNVPTCLPATDLALSNISSSSADLSWTSDAANFIVAYGAGTDPEEMETVTATSNSITLSGLTSNTSYNVFVRSVCSATDQGPWSRMATFRTLCSAATIPWSEGFETLATGSSTSPAPECWALLNANQGTTPYCYVNNTDTYVSEGTQSLYFVSNSAVYAYAILPPFDTPLNQLQISYKCNFESNTSSGYLTLGYMTNFMDESTFVPLYTAERLANKAFSVCEVLLDSVPTSAANARLAFRYGGGPSNNYYAGVDEVSVTMIPTCRKPADVAVSNITTTSATISWTGDEGNYTVAYGAGTNPEEMQTVSASTTSADLTSLTPNTEYNVFVKAVCSATDQSEWSLIENFKTACLALEATDLPWSENFDNVTTSSTDADMYQLLPDCWNLVEMEASTTTLSNFPRVYYSTTYPTSGSYCFYMYYRTKVALPYINTDLNTLQLDLNVRQSSSSYKLVVGVMSDLADATTFVPIDTISCSSTTASEHFNVKLNNYTGNGHYIVLRNYNTSSSTNYASNYIDDVTVSVLPSCIEPVDVVASNIEATGATISWTSDASNFTIAYGEGSDPDAMQTVSATTNSVALTGLTANTTYHVFVKATCSATEESPWSAMATFTTPCSAVALPYEENFETCGIGEVVSCWDNSMSTSTSLTSNPDRIWGVTTYGGNNFIRMYNYFVQSGIAAINTPAIVLPAAGIYELKFDVSNMASCGDMIVKITTDGGATYTNLDTISNLSGVYEKENPGTTFVPVTIDLTAFAGNTINVQFWSTANYGSGAIFVDNVIVRETPSCVEPADVVVSNVDVNNATISWTGSASSYLVAYGEGTDPETMQTVTATTNSATLTGLTQATVYNVFVKATCSATDVSGWSIMATFSTLCGMIDLPYEEGFETLTSLDNSCWDFYMNDGSSFVDITTAFASEGYSSLLLDSYSCIGINDTIYAALPMFDTINNGYLAFDYKLAGTTSTYGYVSLGYLTNPTDFTTFTLISQLPQTSTFTTYMYDLSNLPADAQRLVITYDNYYRAWIDQVRILRNLYADVTIAANDTTMGSLNPAAGTYRYNVGETITVTATPNAGYQFLNWNVDGVNSTTNPFTMVLTDNNAFQQINVTAYFDLDCATPAGVSVSNVTDNSALVSWIGNGNNYIVAYGEGTNPDSMATVSATTTSVELTGLNATTTYHVFVKTICSATESSNWSAMVTFSTPCSNIDIPFVENFETFTGSCWDFYMTNSNSYFALAEGGSDGGYSLQFDSWDANTTDLLFAVLPRFDSINNGFITFMAKNNGTGDSYGYLTLGYITNNDINTFTTLQQLPQSTSFTRFIYDLSNVPATADRLVIMYNNYYRAWIDELQITRSLGANVNITVNDLTMGTTTPAPGVYNYNVGDIATLTATPNSGYQFMFWTMDGETYTDATITRTITMDDAFTSIPVLATFAPSCSAPLVVNIDTVESYGATLSWMGGYAGYTVAYGTGTDPATMDVVNVTTNSVSLTNLLPLTTYNVFVKSQCSDTEISDWSAMYSFTTLCGVYNLPYSENFESQTSGQAALCWDNSMSNTSTLWSYPSYVWGVYNYSGNSMIRMYNYYVQSGIAAINTPAINLPASGIYELKFDVSHLSSNGNLIVKVTTDDGATYTNIDTIVNESGSYNKDNPGTFVPVTLDLTAFAGNTINVQFWTNANYGSGAIFVDNVIVRETPTCPEPTDVVVSDVTTTNATISWTSESTNFIVAYGEGTDHDAMATVAATGNSVVLNGLNQMSLYHVFVKAVCSATDQSPWSAMATFATPCAGIELPYVQGFESVLNMDNSCWDFYLTSTSSFVAIDGNESSEGNYSLIFDSWNASQSDIIYAILPEFDSVNNGYLLFDYMNYGADDPTYGYISVGYLTDGSDITTYTAISQLPQTEEFAPYMLDLSTIPATAERLVISYNNYYRAWIDNVQILRDAYVDVQIAMADATMGTSTPAPGVHRYNVGETVSVTAIPNPGYLFVNWNLNGTIFTTPTIQTVMNDTNAFGSIQLVATFEIDTTPAVDSATIALAVNDATMGTINPVAGNYALAVGETFSATATANTGYHFVNWTVNGAAYATTAALSYTVAATDADQTLNIVANFEQDSATIVLAVNDATMGTINPVAGTYRVAVGETVSATATANTGYHFLNWTINGTVEGTNTTLSVTVPATAADQTFNVVANFEQDAIPEPDSATVVLAVNDATMGTTNPVAGSYRVAVGEQFTVAATANEGFHFVSWTLNNADYTTDLSCTLLISESDADATLNLTAVFAEDVVEPVAHAVSVIVMDTNNNQNVGGTVTGAGNYYPGETVTLTATAAAGYTFVGWTDGANLFITDNPYSFPMGEEDIQVYAIFAQHVGINDAEMDNVIVFSQNGNIVIRGAEGHTLYVYDAVGRMISHTANANIEESVKVPATGVYIVKVDNLGTRRIVVKR